ncbi:unnamed protein product, partial [Trichogramma brassicae]
SRRSSSSRGRGRVRVRENDAFKTCSQRDGGLAHTDTDTRCATVRAAAAAAAAHTVSSIARTHVRPIQLDDASSTTCVYSLLVRRLCVHHIAACAFLHSVARASTPELKSIGEKGSSLHDIVFLMKKQTYTNAAHTTTTTTRVSATAAAAAAAAAATLACIYMRGLQSLYHCARIHLFSRKVKEPHERRMCRRGPIFVALILIVALLVPSTTAGRLLDRLGQSIDGHIHRAAEKIDAFLATTPATTTTMETTTTTTDRSTSDATDVKVYQDVTTFPTTMTKVAIDPARNVSVHSSSFARTREKHVYIGVTSGLVARGTRAFKSWLIYVRRLALPPVLLLVFVECKTTTNRRMKTVDYCLYLYTYEHTHTLIHPNVQLPEAMAFQLRDLGSKHEARTQQHHHYHQHQLQQLSVLLFVGAAEPERAIYEQKSGMVYVYTTTAVYITIACAVSAVRAAHLCGGLLTRRRSDATHVNTRAFILKQRLRQRENKHRRVEEEPNDFWCGADNFASLDSCKATRTLQHSLFINRLLHIAAGIRKEEQQQQQRGETVQQEKEKRVSTTARKRSLRGCFRVLPVEPAQVGRAMCTTIKSSSLLCMPIGILRAAPPHYIPYYSSSSSSSSSSAGIHVAKVVRAQPCTAAASSSAVRSFARLAQLLAEHEQQQQQQQQRKREEKRMELSYKKRIKIIRRNSDALNLISKRSLSMRRLEKFPRSARLLPLLPPLPLPLPLLLLAGTRARLLYRIVGTCHARRALHWPVREWAPRRRTPVAAPSTSNAVLDLEMKTMVIRFSSANARETFLAAAPKFQRLSTHAIFGIADDGRPNHLRANVILPSDRHRLYRRCAAAAEAHGYPRPFVRNLCIYMRRARDSAPICIMSDDDLALLVSRPNETVTSVRPNNSPALIVTYCCGAACTRDTISKIYSRGATCQNPSLVRTISGIVFSTVVRASKKKLLYSRISCRRSRYVSPVVIKAEKVEYVGIRARLQKRRIEVHAAARTRSCLSSKSKPVSWEEWWTYDGISGPAFWGLINPEWSLCNKGRPTVARQSRAGPSAVGGVLTNTGHSVVFTVDNDTRQPVNISGGPLSYRYQFHEIHLHYGLYDNVGSEHTVDGYSFPAEIQIFGFNSHLYNNFSDALHRAQGIVAVSLLLQVRIKRQSIDIKRIGVRELLPDTMHYMTYDGSTTMPACHETTTWIILNKPIYITKQQLRSLRELKQGDKRHPKAPLGNNFRPPQPLHHRPVRTNIDFNIEGPKNCPTMNRDIYYKGRQRRRSSKQASDGYNIGAHTHTHTYLYEYIDARDAEKARQQQRRLLQEVADRSSIFYNVYQKSAARFPANRYGSGQHHLHRQRAALHALRIDENCTAHDGARLSFSATCVYIQRNNECEIRATARTTTTTATADILLLLLRLVRSMDRRKPHRQQQQQKQRKTAAASGGASAAAASNLEESL